MKHLRFPQRFLINNSRCYFWIGFGQSIGSHREAGGHRDGHQSGHFFQYAQRRPQRQTYQSKWWSMITSNVCHPHEAWETTLYRFCVIAVWPLIGITLSSCRPRQILMYLNRTLCYFSIYCNFFNLLSSSECLIWRLAAPWFYFQLMRLCLTW